MSDPKIRRTTVTPSDEAVEPVKSLPVEVEEDKSGDKISATNAALEATEKPADTSAAEAAGNAGMTQPRTVGLLGAVSFIVGTIIGSGIFISPKGVAERSGSVAFTLCSWAICGIICTLAGLCYAEMGCVIRSSGADYAYLDAAFGSAVSFIFCWCYTVLKTATMTTLALTFSQYILTALFNDGCGSAPGDIKKILAVAVLLLLLAINVYSLELTTRIQIIFMVAKLLALAIIIVGGIVMLFQGHTKHLKTGFNNTETNPGTIAVGFYGGMFAYDAWNAANFISEEIINPERNLPLSIIIALPLCMVIYVLTIVSYFSVMSIAEMIDSEAVAMTWAERVIPTVSWLIPIFVAMSSFGSSNGTLFTNARLLYVTGRKGHMPEVLGMVNVDRYTLSPASIAMTVFAVIFTFVGDIDVLINFISFLGWIFYGMNMLSLIVFRYKAKYKNLPRPFRIPLVIPVFVFCCAIFIVVVPIATDPKYEFLYAAAFIAVGYVFYFPFVYFGLSLPFMNKVTMFFQLYLRVAKTKQSLD